MAAQFEPVDFDPFAKAPAKGAQAPAVDLEPVDFDPFERPTVTNRGIVFPVADMSDGTTQLAVPETIHAPYRSLVNVWERIAADPGAPIDGATGAEALLAATGAITGPVGAGAKAAAAAVPQTVTGAAERLGVALPRAAAGGDVAQAAGALAKEVPGPLFGNSLVNASQKALDDIGTAAKAALTDAGTGRKPEQSFRDWFQARGLDEDALAAEAGAATKPKPVAAYEAPTGPDGAMRITTPDNAMEVTARPQLVELDDLKTAAGDFQPRDRTRAEYVQGVRERAARLDPEQLRPGRVSDSGAPIVLEDGTIISGNGRAMSIAEAYRNPAFQAQGDAYRASLGPDAANMRNPVMVMRAEGLAGDDAARFADLSNRGRIAQMSATERAGRDAKALGLDDVALYKGGDFTAPQNEAFLRSFTSKAVAKGEGAAFSKNGQLTQEGVQRMRNAVLAAAYDDAPLLSRLVESADDNVRSLTGAMTDVAPKLAQLKADIGAGVVKSELDPTGSLVAAVKKIADLRNQGSTPARYFAQADAFDDLDPLAKTWIKALYNEDLARPISREKLSTLLGAYIDEAGKHAPGGLFDDPTTINDVIGVAVRAAGKDAGAPDLLASAAASAPASQAETRYISRMMASGSDKSEAELRAAFRAKNGEPKPPPASAGAPAPKPTADDGLNAWKARPKTAQEIVFEARKARLGNALGLDGNVTPSAALTRIADMAASRASADVSGLLKAKGILDAETWSDIGQELLRRSGLGSDLGGFAVAYDGMTDSAKTALFGSALKSRLDDLAQVAGRLERLETLATPQLAEAFASVPLVGGALSGLFRNKLGQVAAVASVSSVDMGLGTLSGLATAKFLSRPQGSKTLTRFMSALADSASEGDRQSRLLLVLAARNLAKELADETGDSERDIAAQIDAAVAEAMKGGR